jgi:hypothetical protein
MGIEAFQQPSQGLAGRSARAARQPGLLLGRALLLCLLAFTSVTAPASAAAVPGPCPPPPPASVVSGGALPPPALVPAIPAPTEVVLACAGQYPITGAAFNHWAKVARKSDEPAGARKHGTKVRPLPVAITVSEVMGFLISGDWVIGEAAQLGIPLSEATVKRRFDHIRGQQFPRRREFRHFLRESGQTIADLLLRVRLNMLSAAIQKRVGASAKNPTDRQRALSEFVRGFKARWRAQTVCVKAFTVADCGSTQEPPL